MRRVLHAGCANHALPEWFADYAETRLDIDPTYGPDIVASLTNLGPIGKYDAVWCSHTLEHLYPHEVPVALREFRRVLNTGGAIVLLVPDLGDVRPTDDVLYETHAGAVTGLDLIYGLRWTIEQTLHMAHHTGFTDKTMQAALDAAGFSKIDVKRLPLFQLFAAGVK